MHLDNSRFSHIDHHIESQIPNTFPQRKCSQIYLSGPQLTHRAPQDLRSSTTSLNLSPDFRVTASWQFARSLLDSCRYLRGTREFANIRKQKATVIEQYRRSILKELLFMTYTFSALQTLLGKAHAFRYTTAPATLRCQEPGRAQKVASDSHAMGTVESYSVLSYSRTLVVNLVQWFWWRKVPPLWCRRAALYDHNTCSVLRLWPELVRIQTSLVRKLQQKERLSNDAVLVAGQPSDSRVTERQKAIKDIYYWVKFNAPSPPTIWVVELLALSTCLNSWSLWSYRVCDFSKMYWRVNHYVKWAMSIVLVSLPMTLPFKLCRVWRGGRGGCKKQS